MHLIDYAFPNYDDVLPMIKGFDDASYKNDSAPSIHKLLSKDIYLVLYCDYKNKKRRENPESFRYSLCLDMPMILCNAKYLYACDDIVEMKHFIDNHTIDDYINMKEFFD